MINRLSEIHGTAPPAGKTGGESVASSAAGAGESSEMTVWRATVEHLNERMTVVEANIGAIDEAYTQELQSTSAAKADELTLRLENLVAETNKESRAIAQQLKQLQGENKAFRGSNAELRARQSMHAATAKRFYLLMQQYQGLKTKNEQKYREKVARQVEIATGQTPSPQQLDEIIEAGDAHRLFSTQLLQQPQRNQDASHALEFITERHNDFVRLERSITELYQIFLDMATLVDTQGETVNMIEFNVQKSEAYTEQATANIEKGKRYVIRRRRCKCYLAIVGICLCLLILVAVIIGILFATKQL